SSPPACPSSTSLAGENARPDRSSEKSRSTLVARFWRWSRRNSWPRPAPEARASIMHGAGLPLAWLRCQAVVGTRRSPHLPYDRARCCSRQRCLGGSVPMASPLRSTIVSSLTKPRSWIDRLWIAVAERGRAYIAVPSTTLAPLERARRLAMALLSERGEASGAAVARELHAVLRDLGPEERLGFYRFLAAGFLPDEGRLRAAAEAYLAQPSAERAALLAEAAEPARQELLRRMNMSMGGTAALVAMRKELLGRLRQEPALKPLDGDLRHLFASWFNRGFLELRLLPPLSTGRALDLRRGGAGRGAGDGSAALAHARPRREGAARARRPRRY